MDVTSIPVPILLAGGGHYGCISVRKQNDQNKLSTTQLREDVAY